MRFTGRPGGENSEGDDEEQIIVGQPVIAQGYALFISKRGS